MQLPCLPGREQQRKRDAYSPLRRRLDGNTGSPLFFHALNTNFQTACESLNQLTRVNGPKTIIF